MAALIQVKRAGRRLISQFSLAFQEAEMRLIALTLAAALCILGLSPAMAQQTAAEVPQSIRFQHEQTISRLSHFAQSEDREFAAAAQKAVTFLKEQGCGRPWAGLCDEWHRVAAGHGGDLAYPSRAPMAQSRLATMARWSEDDARR
jgi:hypothetical protein